MTGRILTFGETMGLVVADQVGSLAAARACTLDIGGAESNLAMAAARLGTPATWVGRVGADAVGDLVADRVRGAGVDARVVRDPDAFTGVMVRSRPVGSAVRVDYHRRGSAGSRLRADDVPEELVRTAGVLHVTGITAALGPSARQAVFSAVESARASGVLVSLDVNHRAKLWTADEANPVLRDLVGRADIVFAGVDEAELVLGEVAGSAGDAARMLAAEGPAEVVVKDGARGAVAVVDGRALVARPVPVRQVDPVGAGDAFAAGYLVERLAGLSPSQRLHTAAESGAWAVGVPGDCRSLPTREDLALLRAAGGPEVVR